MVDRLGLFNSIFPDSAPIPEIEVSEEDRFRQALKENPSQNIVSQAGSDLLTPEVTQRLKAEEEGGVIRSPINLLDQQADLVMGFGKESSSLPQLRTEEEERASAMQQILALGPNDMGGIAGILRNSPLKTGLIDRLFDRKNMKTFSDASQRKGTTLQKIQTVDPESGFGIEINRMDVNDITPEGTFAISISNPPIETKRTTGIDPLPKDSPGGISDLFNATEIFGMLRNLEKKFPDEIKFLVGNRTGGRKKALVEEAERVGASTMVQSLLGIQILPATRQAAKELKGFRDNMVSKSLNDADQKLFKQIQSGESKKVPTVRKVFEDDPYYLDEGRNTEFEQFDSTGAFVGTGPDLSNPIHDIPRRDNPEFMRIYAQELGFLENMNSRDIGPSRSQRDMQLLAAQRASERLEDAILETRRDLEINAGGRAEDGPQPYDDLPF